MALATPWGESALAILRASGEDSIELMARVFTPPEALRRAKHGHMIYGRVRDPDTGETLDEVMAAVFRAPGGFTGEDSVEINCHGSLAGIARIQALLRAHGFRDASPGEFSFRAFVNGKMDLTQAEAIQEMVKSKSSTAHGLAVRRLSGEIRDEINAMKSILTRCAAGIAVELDYAEDEVLSDRAPILSAAREVRVRLKRLRESYAAGRLYQEGVKLVLAGKTNAGKSSLFNRFLREDRSIVSEFHGTTRDYIESWVTIGGVPVSLFDTAGIREADNPVEREGIRRTEAVLASADCVCYLVDGSRGLDEEDRAFLAARDVIPVWTKIDLETGSAPQGFIPFSAKSGEGFAELERAILERVSGGVMLHGDQPVIDSARQKDLLDRASEALDRALFWLERDEAVDGAALEVREALDALGEITGEVTAADILETMFGNFCLGK